MGSGAEFQEPRCYPHTGPVDTPCSTGKVKPLRKSPIKGWEALWERGIREAGTLCLREGRIA